MNDKKNDKTTEAVTLNGVKIHGVGIHAITRRGNLATETLGFGVALMVEDGNGRTRLRLLADLLKGCRSLEGAAYEKYTAEAWSEARALILAADFSEATGVSLLPKDAEAVKELKEKAEARKAEAAKKNEDGKKKPKKAKTGAERIAEIVGKLDAAERVGALLSVLDTLNKEAAGAARLVISGVTAEEAARHIIKAREEAEAARKMAEHAARK